MQKTLKPKRPLSFKEFMQIYSKVPRVCVDLIIKYKNGVILTKRNIEPNKGLWHLPGGTILFNETIEQSAKRVAEEELGVGIDLKKFLGPIEFINEGGIRHSISIATLAVITGGEPKITNNEASDWKVFTKPPQDTIKEHKHFLQKLKVI